MIGFGMTRLLEQALNAVRELSDEEQDEIAWTILELVGADDGEPVALTPEERRAIALSREAARRGEYATEQQIDAVLSKYAQ
jgi:hypothetical protein